MVSRIASFTFVMSVLLFPMMGLAVLISGPAHHGPNSAGLSYGSGQL